LLVEFKLCRIIIGTLKFIFIIFIFIEICNNSILFQGLEFEYDLNSQLYLTFKNTEIRDNLYDNLLNQSKLKMEKHERCIMTLKWQNGALSNYDYLLYLNRYL